MVKIPFAWQVGDCSLAWRAGFGRGRSDARRPSQGGVLGGRVSRGVVGVGIVSARRSGLSGVSKNVGQRAKVRSASTEGAVRGWGLMMLVVRQRSKRSRGGCHACQGAGDKRVP